MARNVEYIINLRDRFSGKLGRVGKNVNRLDGQMNSLRRTAGLLFAGFVAQRVVGGIIEVGSEFEQLQISFETMLGSADKATALIKELTKFAIKTPFELKDVSKGAKSLLAFGIAEEKILPTLKSLGDVAAGLSVPIERLILNFGQVQAQTKLTGRELRDFAIAGVPLLQVLADNMGKTTAQIKEMVSAGDIGFADVEQAFISMSSEGGKFFNLMERQTASTGGQISNLRDVVSLLADDLFKRLQPTINLVVVAIQDMTAFLRENIDMVLRIGKVLAVAVTAFLAYKAIVLGSTAVMALFNIVVAANPILVVVGAMAAAVGIYLLFNKTVAKTVKIQSNLKKVQDRLNMSLAKERVELNRLFRVAKNEAVSKEARKKAIQEINTQYGQYLPNLLTEKSSVQEIEVAQRNANIELLRNIKIKIKREELTRIETERLAKSNKAFDLIAEDAKALSGETFDAFKAMIGSFQEWDFIVNEDGLISIQKFSAEASQSISKFSNRYGVSILKATKAAFFLRDANRLAGLSVKELDAFFGRDLLGVTAATAAGADAARAAAAKAGITKITSAAPKIFNINIDTLVENFEVKSTTITEAATGVRDKMVEALLAALADTQTLAR